MARIKLLSPNVINKIAAGEVVERPASVVKELIENSIDAEATSITVELKNGGKKLIRITDNGYGMDREDIALAFRSHSTSKLLDPEELFHITTMGFRGEALPSIGSVSQAAIVSRAAGSDTGYETSIDGGKPGEVRRKGCPEGTTVIVRNLFFNTPVRMKFLKSDATELSHIVNVVTRIALAHCHIRFELIHNEKTLFLLSGHDRLLDRIGHFYGDEMAESLLPLESHTTKVHVSGYLAPPSVSRRDAKMQHIYLNSRPVRERIVYAATKGAYEGLLTVGRSPVVFVFIDIDPREVDVNVHPTKSEVRFRNPSAVHAQLRAAMKDVLAQVEAAPLAPAPDAGGRPSFDPAPRPGPFADRGVRIRRAVQDYLTQHKKSPDATLPFGAPGGAAVAPALRTAGAAPFFQVHDSYIVIETGEGIEIIDQHALHEKIIYERLASREGGGSLHRQQMLIPPTVELSAAQWASRERIIESLASLGFEAEPFGGRSLAVRAVPQAVAGSDAASMLRDMAEEIVATGKSGKVDELREALRKLAACKAAVKAGEKLSDEQIAEMLRQRAGLSERYSCPHGRPMALRFTLDELEKRFRRK